MQIAPIQNNTSFGINVSKVAVAGRKVAGNSAKRTNNADKFVSNQPKVKLSERISNLLMKPVEFIMNKVSEIIAGC